MLFSTLIVAAGIAIAWLLYGRRPIHSAEQPDIIQVWNPELFGLLQRRFLIDEIYDVTVVRAFHALSRLADHLDRFVWGGLVLAVSYLVLLLAWIDRLIDEFVINFGFNQTAESVRHSARFLSLFQNGNVHRYLRVLAISLAILGLFILWGCTP